MILQSWWFQLYTRPFLIRLLQFFGATLTFDIVLSYGGYSSKFVYLLPLVALVNKFTPGSFRENIEFHKMNVPFAILRKNFLADIATTALAYLVLFGLTGGLSRLAGGFFSTEAASPFLELTKGMILYYTLAFCIAIFWVCFIAVDKKYVFYGIKHRTFVQTVFFAVPIWIVCLIQMMVALYLGFSVELSYTFMLGSVFFGSSIFFLKAIFHKGPTHASLWNWMKHYGFGTATVAVIFFLAALLGRKDVLDENLNIAQRVNSFRFYGHFSPYIDRKTFALIEPELDLTDRDLIYKHVAFDPSGLGLGFFLDDSREQTRLMAFLDFGRPSVDFLLSLYSHMGSHPEHWDKVPAAEWVRHKAFHRWPKDRPLPEKYLAEKKKADDFAELRKLKRGVASGSGR